MATNVPLLTGIIESIIPQNGGGTSDDVTKVYVDTQDQYILQQANTYTNQQLSLKGLPNILPQYEGYALFIKNQVAKWDVVPNQVPNIPNNSEGYVLQIKNNTIVWESPQSGLPTIPINSNGYVLTINNDQAVWGQPPSGLPSISPSVEGKVLVVKSQIAQWDSIPESLPAIPSNSENYVLTIKNSQPTWVLPVQTLPTIDPSVEDYALVVKNQHPQWVELSNNLPIITALDESKVLTVKNQQASWEILPDQLPSIVQGQENYVLTVKNSQPTWYPVEKELPSYSSNEENKVLSVKNQQLSWENIPNELPSIDTSSEDKVLTVKNQTAVWYQIPKELPTISPELENNILTVESQTAKWKPSPKLTSTIFIPIVGDFDTALRNAITNANPGDVLDFTGWTGTHYINSDNGTVNIAKPLTLLFGNITIKFKSKGRTSHMFYITSSSVRIIGYGRSSNVDDLSGATKLVMEIANGYTNGGYHIKSWSASALHFESFDLLGVRSNYNENEGTFTGAGGIFLEKPNPDITASGNNINNLIINNLYIQGTVAHGIYVNTPIISRITNVRVSQAGKHGIYIRGGTSIVMDAVYVSSAHLAGICLQEVSYSSIVASASENAGVGYWLRSCSAVTLFGSGAENCLNKGSGDSIFGSGYNNSRILNYNGNIIDDCSADYRDIFRGTSYVISGGRNILLNGPYSINASLIGEAGTTSTLSAHFRIMGNARYIQILSPRCSMSSGNTFAGRFDVRIEAVGADAPRDCTIDFNPYEDGSVVPQAGKPYVTEFNTSYDACPIYNIGQNTLIRWGNTKWAFEKIFTPTGTINIDFSRYDIYTSDTNNPMNEVNLFLSLTNPIKNKTITILLPPLGTGTVTWANTIFLLNGILHQTYSNVIYIHCVQDGSNPVYFVTYAQPIMKSPT